MMTTVYDDDGLEQFEQINVIPLIDVMLVLLTIVLATATFVVNGSIPVDLAKAKTANAAVQTPYTLTLTRQRQLYLNDRLVPSVGQALQNVDKSSAIVIRADSQLALADFVSLADDVKQLGFNQVSLEVQRP
jgi:biopolymer transport protein ExbD